MCLRRFRTILSENGCECRNLPKGVRNVDEEREVIDPEVVDDGDGPRSGYEKYGRHFSEGGFWAKTAKVALRAGWI